MRIKIIGMSVGIFALAQSTQAFAVYSWCNTEDTLGLPIEWKPLCELPPLGPKCRFIPGAQFQCRNDMLVDPGSDPGSLDPQPAPAPDPTRGDVPDFAWFPASTGGKTYRCQCRVLVQPEMELG